jgi:hypothetical protein
VFCEHYYLSADSCFFFLFLRTIDAGAFSGVCDCLLGRNETSACQQCNQGYVEDEAGQQCLAFMTEIQFNGIPVGDLNDDGGDGVHEAGSIEIQREETAPLDVMLSAAPLDSLFAHFQVVQTPKDMSGEAWMDSLEPCGNVRLLSTDPAVLTPSDSSVRVMLESGDNVGVNRTRTAADRPGADVGFDMGANVPQWDVDLNCSLIVQFTGQSLYEYSGMVQRTVRYSIVRQLGDSPDLSDDTSSSTLIPEEALIGGAAVAVGSAMVGFFVLYSRTKRRKEEQARDMYTDGFEDAVGSSYAATPYHSGMPSRRDTGRSSRGGESSHYTIDSGAYMSESDNCTLLLPTRNKHDDLDDPSPTTERGGISSMLGAISSMLDTPILAQSQSQLNVTVEDRRAKLNRSRRYLCVYVCMHILYDYTYIIYGGLVGGCIERMGADIDI